MPGASTLPVVTSELLSLSEKNDVLTSVTATSPSTRTKARSKVDFRSVLLAGVCCAFAALGSFLFGYDTGIIGSAIAQPDFIRHFGEPSLSDATTGGIVSSFTAGAIIGTLAVSSVADGLGRRAAIFLGSVFASLGGALQGGANILATMVIGRVFAGIGVGLMSATIPNYCSEIAPTRVRGLLGGMQQWMIGLGIVSAQWVGYGGSRLTGPISWRLPLSLQVGPAIVLAIGTYLLPESPRFLAERGRLEEAQHVLEYLHLNRNATNQQQISLEMRQIQDAIEMEKRLSHSTDWKQLCLHRPLRKRILLASSIQLFTQLSGTNVIGYYGPRIYASLGYTVTGSLFIVGLYGALALGFNTVCMGFVDKVGRRKLLIPSMIGMGAALCVEATLAKYYDPASTTNTHALRASVAMNFVFALFFTSLGVISWIYPSEVFPTVIRAKGTALSTCTNWTINLIVAQCSPVALTRLGYKYFYLFTAFNWTAAILVFLYYPETLGRSLEEVMEVFDDCPGGVEITKSLDRMEPAPATMLDQSQ